MEAHPTESLEKRSNGERLIATYQTLASGWNRPVTDEEKQQEALWVYDVEETLAKKSLTPEELRNIELALVDFSELAHHDGAKKRAAQLLRIRDFWS